MPETLCISAASRPDANDPGDRRRLIRHRNSTRDVLRDPVAFVTSATWRVSDTRFSLLFDAIVRGTRRPAKRDRQLIGMGIWSMFAQQKTFRLATALLALAGIASTSLSSAASAHNPCGGRFSVTAEGAANSGTACPRERACCCGAKAQPRGCSCHRNDKTPLAPSSAPYGLERVLKSVPWMVSPAPPCAVVAPEQAVRLQTVNLFFSPCERSVQSLLCVWRI